MHLPLKDYRSCGLDSKQNLYSNLEFYFRNLTSRQKDIIARAWDESVRLGNYDVHGSTRSSVRGLYLVLAG
jgi:hypothetical protein